LAFFVRKQDPVAVYWFIASERARQLLLGVVPISVVTARHVLVVSRAGYYSWLAR
jgi:hypothetical protein